MSRGQPLSLVWWLVSRASGILALVLVAGSVLLGLAMATRALRRPALRRAAMQLHEHLAVTAVMAIAVHGASLLGDHWLKPGWRGITIPFFLHYRPGFTGAGIISGYLAVLLGPSFYLRRRIGGRRWRNLHRATVLVWGLAVAHTLGAGSDAGTVWLRAIVLAPLPLVVYLLVLRASGRRPLRQPPVMGLGRSRMHPGPASRHRGTHDLASHDRLARCRGLRDVPGAAAPAHPHVGRDGRGGGGDAPGG